VDTIVVKVADSVYMGYCIEEKAELGNNVVDKIAPALTSLSKCQQKSSRQVQ
jgi:hypothetical protein